MAAAGTSAPADGVVDVDSYAAGVSHVALNEGVMVVLGMAMA